MAKELPSLGDFEVQILKLVWEHEPCTERRIWDVVQQGRDLARTTVLKTIQRLESKGLLVRVPGEGPVRFRAAMDENRVVPKLIERFVDTVLGGSAEPLVAYLADSEKLSTKDLDALRAIARKIRAEQES